MLFKISVKNIRKSFKDYAVYFFTLILGVAVFYVFNAIDSQTVMLDVRKNVYDIIKLMNEMLSGVSVFVSCVLGFLIIYASRFLIKRRNKEFGIYLTLGMSKRKISAILFFETLLIGIVSLVVGLLLGTVLSQFMSILVANLFDADMTKFKFTFSSKACVKTLLYFTIMYLLVMVFNAVNISRCKLIDLLNAGKKTEKVKMKNPVIAKMLKYYRKSNNLSVDDVAAYLDECGISVANKTIYGWEIKIIIPIAMGCVATFLIFWSLSGLLIKIFTSIKSVYYKGVNSFVLRQFCSKINTTVFSTTIICLMLFITISVLSAALSMKNSMSSDLKKMCPVDIQFTKISYEALREAYATADKDSDDYEKATKILEDSKLSISDTLKNNGFDVNEYLKNMTEYSVYQTGLEEMDTLGSLADEIREKYPMVSFLSSVNFMKLSDYNKIATLYGNETYSLGDNEYLIVANFKTVADIRNMALKAGTKIDINGKTYSPKYKECKDGFIELASQHINDGIFIVPDDALTDAQVYKCGMTADYKADSKEEKYDIENKLDDISKNIFNQTSYLSYNSKIDLAEASVGLGALVTFIALYLGIIFLISSAAILALKELSDSADNRERYGMIRKIGVDEKMINMALFKQIGIFFAFPLLLAIIHSVFGIKFINLILQTMGMSSMLASVGITFIFLVVIYGGYFIITYLCSKSIIRP